MNFNTIFFNLPAKALLLLKVIFKQSAWLEKLFSGYEVFFT